MSNDPLKSVKSMQIRHLQNTASSLKDRLHVVSVFGGVFFMLAGILLLGGCQPLGQAQEQQAVKETASSSLTADRAEAADPTAVSAETADPTAVSAEDADPAVVQRPAAENGSETKNSALPQPATIMFPGTNGDKVLLPLQVVKAELSLDDGAATFTKPPKPPKPPAMSYKIPPEMQERLQAVLVYRSDMPGGYLLLAPAGWNASAAVGANGSYGVTLSDREYPVQTLTYSDTAGSCQGCAINSIGTYFPDRAKWADEQGFTVFEPLSFAEWTQQGTTGQDARTAVYTTGLKEGISHTGVVYYEEAAEGYLFRELEFTLLQEKHIHDDQLKIVLDFFRTHHGALIIEE
ncbi:DUF4850 domain-containing protein [Paenibacillus fonticola]|uniref:DUF4850 domain-containing protein n=1 Tax=Paenibacillus fonticola TaxID=379896 RepID=UPI000373C219|nr:DUF4850 domain-containing protein [Paenibacillus fonticola]